MRRGSSVIAATLALGLAAATAASPVRAQTPGYGDAGGGFVEGSGGVALPMGDLADVQDLGGTAELAAAYWVHRRVAVRVDGSLDFLRGADAPSGGRTMPDMTVLRVHGGVEVLLVSPSPRFRVTAGLGGGVAVYDTDEFGEPVFNPATDEPEADFNQAYATSSGRLKLAYAASSRIAVFASGGARLSFADAEDTALFAAFDPGLGESGSDLLWTVPVTAGVEMRF